MHTGVLITDVSDLSAEVRHTCMPTQHCAVAADKLFVGYRHITSEDASCVKKKHIETVTRTICIRSASAKQQFVWL